MAKLAATVSKFTTKLMASGDDIKKERAVREGAQAARAVRTIMLEKESKLANLESDLERLVDVGSDTSVSLRPTATKDLDYSSWFREVLVLRTKIRIAKDELNDATQFEAEWFS